MTAGILPIPSMTEPGPKDFFVYSAEFLPLAANATQQVRIPIQADSAFLIHEIAGDCRDAISDEVVIAAPPVRLEIRDEGTGRILMDRPQQWDNMIGTAERPFFLPLPKEIKPNSTLVISLINDSANAYKIRLAFIGFKSFPGPS